MWRSYFHTKERGEDINEPKYCPLLTMVDKDNLQECLGEACAWYVRYYTGEGNCALKDIATSLLEIEPK